MSERYRTYSSFLKDTYGEKVYKLPVNLPLTCPNRDGNCGTGGCIFCGEVGAGFETLDSNISVYNQIMKNRKYIGEKYNAKKFIAYFQNFTNTYLPLNLFEKFIKEACLEGVVAIDISTRPDCIDERYLDILDNISDKYNIDIHIELGLQTVNFHTLKKINRGHGLAEFIDAVFMVRKRGYNICAHIIPNLPWDNMDDVIENAKILSALRVNQVKLHALYILKDTPIGMMYEQNEFSLIDLDEYKERVITFLEYLDPQMVIQRLIGRAPAEGSLFVNWGQSWWKIRDSIEEIMEKRNTYQGRLYNYLGGSSLNHLKYD